MGYVSCDTGFIAKRSKCLETQPVVLEAGEIDIVYMVLTLTQ